MRIAMLAPISWRTPPRHYGPWELVTSLLTEALVAKGVDVTLFATADSETAGTLAAVVPMGYSEDRSLDAKVMEMLHVSHVFERASEFDLIHNQADFVPLAFSRLVTTPQVTTIHGFSSERIVPVFKRYDDVVNYVAISDADRHPTLKYAATIHHGIPIDDFPFDAQGSEDLLFFGRIHPDKGAADAIKAAQATGRKLLMAASSRTKAITSARCSRICRRRSDRLSRPHRRRAADARTRRCPGPAPSDRVRRAVRPVGDRGDGVRHAGDRL
jgi:glycosyltransferase involved in cell wall biosynthesis